jgi:hypothetical protein
MGDKPHCPVWLLVFVSAEHCFALLIHALYFLSNTRIHAQKTKEKGIGIEYFQRPKHLDEQRRHRRTSLDQDVRGKDIERQTQHSNRSIITLPNGATQSCSSPAFSIAFFVSASDFRS